MISTLASSKVSRYGHVPAGCLQAVNKHDRRTILPNAHQLPSFYRRQGHTVCQAAAECISSETDSNTITPDLGNKEQPGVVSTSSSNELDDGSALYGRFEVCKLYFLERARQLQEKARQLQEMASQNGSSANVVEPPKLQPELEAHLRSHCRVGDHWLFVHCGEWAFHPCGWEGPALALFQMWKDGDQPDYVVWEVDQEWLPTGHVYQSGSEFERMTSKGHCKKFSASCRVHLVTQTGGIAGSVSMLSWLQRTLGSAARLASKKHLLLGTPSSIRAAKRQMRSAAATEDGSSAAAGASSASAAAASAAAPPHGRTSPVAPMPWSPPVKRVHTPGKQAKFSQHRLDRYVGWGTLPAGKSEAAALAAAESAAAGPPPVYIWPQQAPAVLPPELNMGENTVAQRDNIIRSIASGVDSMSATHVRLQEIYPGLPGPTSTGRTAAEAAAAAAAGSAQIFGVQQLQDHAASSPEQLAVVPDSTRPFTITQYNPADGEDYVVAHYEPSALAIGSSRNAALLCEVFHSRDGSLKMSRTSAPLNEMMVMAGMRVPRGGMTGGNAVFGRYVGDEGPEADTFTFRSWPDLRTTAGFRPICDKWTELLPGLVCAMGRGATEAMAAKGQPYMRMRPGTGPPANYPIPSLFGSPFTTLAVTQNYHSLLHAEPGEHPFSFITWLDVLSSSTQMEVGYFWLTNGLAFLPQNGSALYIDVRLVPHCSDPCTLHNARSPRLEGRYGAALFIKPNVMQTNVEAWASFSKYLQRPGQSSPARWTDR